MILKFEDKYPNILEEVFIAENASIIGEVEVEKDSNIWFGAVLRGDVNYIKVGRRTNIQDNATVHVGYDAPVEIGNDVTIGHNAIVHGCKVGDNCLIGMGATILNNAEIGENTIVGAGSLVTSGKRIPSGVLCMGSPAKVIRELTEEEIAGLRKSAEGYVELSKRYK